MRGPLKIGISILSWLICSAASGAPVCSAVFSDSGRRSITIEGVIDPTLQMKLQRQLEDTRTFYEGIFGEVPGDIKILTTSSTSLRTGYSFKEDNLQFPHVDQIRNSGLESADVINHEVFHLFTCRKFPSLCPQDLATREELLKVHEALADYFAYQLRPGTHFGEGYYVNRAFVREYKTDALLGLTSGAHAEANILVRYLIQNQVPLSQVRTFLESRPSEADLRNLKGLSSKLRENVEKELSYAIADTIDGKSESKLHRYRLNPGETLKISFTPNENLRKDYGDIQVKFQREDGTEPKFFLVQGNGLNFELSIREAAQAEKLLAIFTAGGKTLGARSFYVGPQLPTP